MARERGLDIAVDLMGFTRHARTGVFAARAAPVQVNYLGYPGTVGAAYIDYLIADPTLIPEEQRWCYTEKISYLPHTYQVNDTQRTIADRTFTRQEAGLPDEGFVFCCFNNNWKITPDVFDIWMRLLQQVPGSVLWLFEDNPTAGLNLRAEAARRGIAVQRLVFAPRMNQPEHLARHRLADLFLDTLPYNAHTTCSDALWAGLPVLTRIGETFPSRVAASLLRAVGLPELITESAEAYATLALELATNPPRLANVRQRLAANRPTAPLFDTGLYTRHIEAAYTGMWQRHVAGLPPAELFIPPQSSNMTSEHPD
jgi:predicted O-linked N-acetylglucosamine transferase (SPINDLY family)